MIVTKIIGMVEDFDLSKYEVEKVILDHNEMAKNHLKAVGDKGSAIGISLDPGQVLNHGSVLYQSGDNIIVVEGQDEDVLAVRPKGEIEWGVTCFNLGNLHAAVYFDKDVVLVPFDPNLEKILMQLQVNYKRERRLLSGVRGNIHQHH